VRRTLSRPDVVDGVVPLNEAAPTLGYLDPPLSPRDRRPRLEISFAVNAKRWLVATVPDLQAERAHEQRAARAAAVRRR
jgi:hypothetical protein